LFCFSYTLYIQNSSRCSKARSQTIMGSIHKYVTHVVLRTQHRYSVKYEESILFFLHPVYSK
ncbi:hypothetical protein ACBQ54_00005, partial [Providencia vermicola]